jgi:hypothetical protein
MRARSGEGEWLEPVAIGLGGCNGDYYRLVNTLTMAFRQNWELHMGICRLGGTANSTAYAGNGMGLQVDISYGNRQTYGNGSDADSEQEKRIASESLEDAADIASRDG